MGRSPERASEFDQFTSFTQETISNFDPERALVGYNSLRSNIENPTYLWVAAFTALIRAEIRQSPLQEEFRTEIDRLTDLLVEKDK